MDAAKVAAARVLSRLEESGAIQFVSSRGPRVLVSTVAMVMIEHWNNRQRARVLAESLIDHIEVVDLFIDDDALETVLVEEWDGFLVRSPPSRVARNDDLEAQLLANHRDVARYLIYSDWLQAAGDPYGELIARQIVAHQEGASEASKREAHAYLDAHAHELLGPLAEYVGKVIHLEWRAGFIYRAEVCKSLDDPDSYEGHILLRWLLEHRASLVLRELELETLDHASIHGRPSGQTQAMIDVLTELAPAKLKFLCVFANSDPVRFDPMLDALPNLKGLILHSAKWQPRPRAFPRLRALDLDLNWRPETVSALIASDLPELEALSLHGASVFEDGQDLLTNALFSKLRHLSVPGSRVGLSRLANGRLLARLETLDLSEGDLDDDAIEAILVPLRHRFTHLDNLSIGQNALSEAGAARIRELLPEVAVEIEAQSQPQAPQPDDPDEPDDDDYDDDYDDEME